MTLREVRKQISMFVPLSDWRAIRAEAVRQRIPISELCRRWMKPRMDRLRQRQNGDERPIGHSAGSSAPPRFSRR